MKVGLIKIFQIYDLLIQNLYSGLIAVVVLRTIREEYTRYQTIKRDIPFEDDIFIGTLAISTYNTMILALANTIKPNDDSISLSYLFNNIKNGGNEINDSDQLIKFIGEFENELARIKSITDSVVTLRDKTVAHIDRKYINNPSSLIINPPVKWEDMDKAYDIIFNGLLKIGKYLNIDANLADCINISNRILAKETQMVFRLFYDDQGNHQVVSII
jgi:hypothetical protein